MDPTKVDRIIEQAMRLVSAPGAAVVIVDGDQTYVRGYGVKSIESAEPIAPTTLFAIASVSKAFTATTCAALVDDGKLTWDEPVRTYLPHVRLLDPAADAHVCVRDLLSHRTGLPRHDALWYHTTLDRTTLLRRMAHLKPTASYRGLYQYSNLCYLAAGEAAAAASEKPFETVLREKLLTPLGMHTVTFSGPGLLSAPDHATPHRKLKGKVTPISPLDFSNIGPAGAINASVSELAHWIRFQLAGGLAADGTRLVSEKNLGETHHPQMIVPFDDLIREYHPERITTTYGLGWSRYDWHGHLVLSHGGAIDGFRSHLALCPREGIGFAVLTNMVGYLPDLVRNALLDNLLAIKPARNWHQAFRERIRKEEAKAKQDRKDDAAHRHKGTKPSLPLAAYAGTYSDPGYGTATVRHDDGKLWLQWESFEVPLTHWHHDVFRTKTDRLGFERLQVTFALDSKGTVASLSLFDQPFAKQEVPR